MGTNLIVLGLGLDSIQGFMPGFPIGVIGLICVIIGCILTIAGYIYRLLK